jgi:hypothetical protein
MTHQIGRSHTEFFDEGNDILDVLGDRIGIADPIPMFGEEVPQAYRDDAVPCRERADHRTPDAEIAERAVHADQRRPLPNVEIGHVISVDVKGLHEGLGLLGSRNPEGRVYEDRVAA